MAIAVPVLCDNGRARHTILLDGGRLILTHHNPTSMELIHLLRSDQSRCCTILEYYRHGFWQPLPDDRAKRVFIPSAIRAWAQIATGAAWPLYKAIDKLIQGPLTAFLLPQHKPLGGRLAFGLPPDAPLLLWGPNADPTTGSEWTISQQQLINIAKYPQPLRYIRPDGLEHALDPDTPHDHLHHLRKTICHAVIDHADQAVRLNA